MTLSGRCQDHPEREGVGICMRCRAVICSECTTRIDGINHCARCLRTLHEATAPKVATSQGAAAVRKASIALLYLAAVLLVWLLTIHLGSGS